MADLSKEGYDIHMTSVYMSISKPVRNNDAQLSQETTTFQCVRIHQDFSQGVHMLPPHMPSRHFIGSKAGLAALSVLLNDTPYPDSSPGQNVNRVQVWEYESGLNSSMDLDWLDTVKQYNMPPWTLETMLRSSKTRPEGVGSDSRSTRGNSMHGLIRSTQ